MAPPKTTVSPESPVTARPQTTVISPVMALAVRVLTFVFLLISLCIMIANEFYYHYAYNAYHYLLATGVIGIAYTVLQTAFTVHFMSTGNRVGGEGLALVDFYGDKAISYLLATGAAAAFGRTVDITDSYESDYLNKANAAAGLLFGGFIFSAVSSIFSSLSLSKKH